MNTPSGHDWQGSTKIRFASELREGSQTVMAFLGCDTCLRHSCQRVRACVRACMRACVCEKACDSNLHLLSGGNNSTLLIAVCKAIRNTVPYHHNIVAHPALVIASLQKQ